MLEARRKEKVCCRTYTLPVPSLRSTVHWPAVLPFCVTFHWKTAFTCFTRSADISPAMVPKMAVALRPAALRCFSLSATLSFCDLNSVSSLVANIRFPLT